MAPGAYTARGGEYTCAQAAKAETPAPADWRMTPLREGHQNGAGTLSSKGYKP